MQALSVPLRALLLCFEFVFGNGSRIKSVSGPIFCAFFLVAGLVLHALTGYAQTDGDLGRAGVRLANVYQAHMVAGSIKVGYWYHGGVRGELFDFLAGENIRDRCSADKKREFKRVVEEARQAGERVRVLGVASSGNLLVASQNKVFVFSCDGIAKHTVPAQTSNSALAVVAATPDGAFWIRKTALDEHQADLIRIHGSKLDIVEVPWRATSTWMPGVNVAGELCMVFHPAGTSGSDIGCVGKDLILRTLGGGRVIRGFSHAALGPFSAGEGVFYMLDMIPSEPHLHGQLKCFDLSDSTLREPEDSATSHLLKRLWLPKQSIPAMNSRGWRTIQQWRHHLLYVNEFGLFSLSCDGTRMIYRFSFKEAKETAFNLTVNDDTAWITTKQSIYQVSLGKLQ